MSNVVDIHGSELRTPAQLAEWLKSGYERGDFVHVIMVVEREDGLLEVAYDRQTKGSLVYNITALQKLATDAAYESVVEDE